MIDLYGTKSAETYNSDFQQMIFSSGKNIEAIIMAMLYDKGLFKYEDKVNWNSLYYYYYDKIT